MKHKDFSKPPADFPRMQELNRLFERWTRDPRQNLHLLKECSHQLYLSQKPKNQNLVHDYTDSVQTMKRIAAAFNKMQKDPKSLISTDPKLVWYTALMLSHTHQYPAALKTVQKLEVMMQENSGIDIDARKVRHKRVLLNNKLRKWSQSGLYDLGH